MFIINVYYSNKKTYIRKPFKHQDTKNNPQPTINKN